MRSLGLIVGLCLLGSSSALALENGLPVVEAFPSIECAGGLRFAGGTAPLALLHSAAERGDVVALSALGCIYAKGIGVKPNPLKAFEYFDRIAHEHEDDPPDHPQARLVAKAFVAVGQYLLSGIAGSDIKPDPERARALFAHAAAYYHDADAQYYLACLYLGGVGSIASPLHASRWLGLAASKGEHRAQAVLGYLLFSGTVGPRQPAFGLMWLTMALDGAGADEPWIREAYEAAFNEATEAERAAALELLKRHMNNRPF
jgi:exopolysaccharide production negative regulator